MPITAKLDELGLPAWIGLMVLGFMVWWPVGLVLLAFIIGSGRMGCGRHSVERWENKMSRMQDKLERMRGRAGNGSWGWGQPPSSGNCAFDEYRTETLRRLEDEQRDFRDFLDRLRLAKDKTEFDQFMTERRNRDGTSPQPPQA
jgi:Protein of unknown function (DUF2852)